MSEFLVLGKILTDETINLLISNGQWLSGYGPI